MNQRGQLLIEFNLAILLVLIPLLFGGGIWFMLELNRTRCAYLTFFEARKALIRKNTAVHLEKACGRTIHEEIDLVPLESLDQNKGELGIGDYLDQASRLWGDASSFYQRSRDSVSTD